MNKLRGKAITLVLYRLFKFYTKNSSGGKVVIAIYIRNCCDRACVRARKSRNTTTGARVVQRKPPNLIKAKP